MLVLAVTWTLRFDETCELRLTLPVPKSSGPKDIEIVTSVPFLPLDDAFPSLAERVWRGRDEILEGRFIKSMESWFAWGGEATMSRGCRGRTIRADEVA